MAATALVAVPLVVGEAAIARPPFTPAVACRAVTHRLAWAVTLQSIQGCIRTRVALAGQAAMSHHGFDAHNRPEYSGGGGEGRDSWRYRWDDGRWLFWGADNRWMWYGDDGQWQYYGNTYVVQRPIVNNFSGGPITIDNPAANKANLSYTLDGNPYTIAPGYSQEFTEDRAWVVQFSRGANLDQGRYGLQSGLYSFTSTDHGWELYRSEFPQTVGPPPAPAAPRIRRHNERRR